MSVRAVRVEAEGLTHRYGRRRTHIHALSFAFDGPGAIAVTGPNGSGKSTLLRIVAGLLRPSAGRFALTLEGRALPPHGRRLAVGLATPDLSFYEEFSARENLAFVARAHGLADPARSASAALDEVGLAARADDRVAAYSSGMKQRLRIAFAVLHDPAVLLLDEPGSHLDDHGRGVVRAVVERHAARGLVLIATNDPAESALATRGVALDA
ncbi:MAG: ATP-binding cassette domain-containing protein [bacterium]